MASHSRIAGAAALLSAASMAVTPAAAAELPLDTARSAVPAAAAWDGDSQNAENHRYRRYRRDRVDAGDVIAGVVILGTIAAIAGAANRNNRGYRDRDYRDRDYRNDPYRDRDRPYQYRPYRDDSRTLGSHGIDRAVDMCVREIERDVRVRTVDSVERLAGGWQVVGSIYNGDGFTCRIGNDGRIEAVDYGARGAWDGAAAAGAAEDRQWDSEAYEQARRARDGGARPAYPGGPIDGDVDQDDGDDGRYSTSQAPDFGA